MATLIFTSIQDIKTFIGGGANISLEMSSIAGSMHDAARDHLLPWLGKAQWEALLDAVENNGATPEETALLPYVQRPLAQFTMYEYSKVGGIQFGEAGIYRAENDQMKSAYKYQENEYRRYMLHKGWESIEEMLAFLEAHENDYNAWYASPATSPSSSTLRPPSGTVLRGTSDATPSSCCAPSSRTWRPSPWSPCSARNSTTK